eukprot:2461482-Amphidinium_carterae.1
MCLCSGVWVFLGKLFWFPGTPGETHSTVVARQAEAQSAHIWAFVVRGGTECPADTGLNGLRTKTSRKGTRKTLTTQG